MATDSEILQAGKLMGDSFKGIGESVLGLRKRKNDAEEEQRKIDLAKAQGEEMAKTPFAQSDEGRQIALGLSNRSIAFDDAMKLIMAQNPEVFLEKFGMSANVTKDPERMATFNKMIESFKRTRFDITTAEEDAKNLSKRLAPATDANGNRVVQNVPVPAVELGTPYENIANKYNGGVKSNPPIMKLDLGNNRMVDVNINDPWEVTRTKLSKETTGALGFGTKKYTEEDLKRLDTIYNENLINDYVEQITTTNDFYRLTENQPIARQIALTLTIDAKANGAKKSAYQLDKDGAVDKSRPKIKQSSLTTSPYSFPKGANQYDPRYPGGGKPAPDTSGKVTLHSDRIAETKRLAKERLDTLDPSNRFPGVRTMIDNANGNEAQIIQEFENKLKSIKKGP